MNAHRVMVVQTQAGSGMARKKIHIHLGPHKTGSSAIQAALAENADILQRDFGLTCIDWSLASKVAKRLNADRIKKAADALQDLAQACAAAPGDCILSCEDLSGTLPGVHKTRAIYPNLWRNLEHVANGLGEFDCRFYFFIRAPEDWVKSAYVQNLKHRQRFSRMFDFVEALNVEDLWEGVTARPAQKLGTAFVQVEYPEQTKQSAMKMLLSAVGGGDEAKLEEIVEGRSNVTPCDTDILLMERINRSSASKEAKRRAKLSLFDGAPETMQAADMTKANDWYSPPAKPATLPAVLEPLWQRVEKRVQEQDEPNLMPDADADLRILRHRIVDAEGDMPEANRRYMINQVEILAYRFRNLPETCFQLGLAISYLRRATPHTRHASTLFQRLWAEEHELLLGTLPTRWLISSFQTFLDHGVNEAQKVIGGSAYFYANMLKAYETERAIEGHPPDATYPNTESQTKMGFPGLDRFKLGGSDLILNTNVLLLELSARDAVAGRVVQEFLARAKAAQTIFSRMDKSRQKHGINHKQFANCWSFFDEP